jgi:hypothetical protein
MKIVATAFDKDHRPTHVFRGNLPKAWQLHPLDIRPEEKRLSVYGVTRAPS